MRIEKLNENKIRIFLNLEDLRQKNIDLHTFMSNSIETQDLFLDMLNVAESEIGFKTKNYRLAIEALASSDGNFVFTITRLRPEKALPSNVVKPRVKRQLVLPNRTLSIHKFVSFDEFLEFCNYINTDASRFIEKLKNSSLYLYKNEYYLILNNLKITAPDLKIFFSIISEFGVKMRSEDLLERKIEEYGKIIFPKNAIATCLKHFAKA